jgi:hypothetical protein
MGDSVDGWIDGALYSITPRLVILAMQKSCRYGASDVQKIDFSRCAISHTLVQRLWPRLIFHYRVLGRVASEQDTLCGSWYAQDDTRRLQGVYMVIVLVFERAVNIQVVLSLWRKLGCTAALNFYTLTYLLHAS